MHYRPTQVTIHSLDAWLLIFLSFEVPPQYHKHSSHNFCKQPQQPDFHFKISGLLAAIELADKSGYLDDGYPDMQILGITILRWYRISPIANPNAKMYMAFSLLLMLSAVDCDSFWCWCGTCDTCQSLCSSVLC